MELMHFADATAREKGISIDIVIEALEEAMAKAERASYGHDQDIRVTIDRKTGHATAKRYKTVVEDEEVENPEAQMTLEEAKKDDKDATIGKEYIEDMPPIQFGRMAAQTVKQVLVQKIREAERENQYEEFKDRIGEVISGVVKRIEFGNVIVDLGRAEAILRRDETIQREHFNVGDRVRAYVYDLRPDNRGPMIMLSRTHPQFMAMLFRQEVPEIYEGTIEIKGVARDPGSRAKIAVHSLDSGLDPVGACVGMRGSRVQAVVSELQGEKVDIIPWSPDLATLVVNGLAPAEVTKVVLDEEAGRIDVVIPDEQLSLAIGRRGQNVRLASMLTGWNIDILTEAEESERRASEFKTRSERFITALDVDEVIAQLLVAEGFTQIDELMEAEASEIASIEGFDDEVADEIKRRAEAYYENLASQIQEKQKELGLTDDLIKFEGLSPDHLLLLADQGIKSLDDLADLAGDELLEMLPAEAMSLEDANAMIMRARAHWFDDEETETAEATAEAESESAA